MYLAAPRDSYMGTVSCKFLWETTDQLWVSAEVKLGSVVLVSPVCKNNELHNSYNDIHNFIMIFIHDVYKFIPTYRLTLSGYPTRETIHQIGVALAIPNRHLLQNNSLEDS